MVSVLIRYRVELKWPLIDFVWVVPYLQKLFKFVSKKVVFVSLHEWEKMAGVQKASQLAEEMSR